MTVIETVETQELQTGIINSPVAGLKIQKGSTDLIYLQNSTTVVVGDIVNGGTGVLLDVHSTTKGFCPPRMTTAQRNTLAALTPQTGCMVYDTSTNKLYVFTGAAFEAITSA